MRNDWRIFGIIVNVLAFALCAFAVVLLLLLFFVGVGWVWQVSGFASLSEAIR